MTYAQLTNRIYQLSGGTDSTAFTAANMTLSMIAAMDRVVSVINRIVYGWQWDDTNQTDLPVAKTTITSGQGDYSIATAHLTIDRIEIKDSSGNWHRLKQIDQQELKRDKDYPLAVGESTRTGAYKSTNGIPEEYDVVGSSIILYPTPNFTQATSLFVYFTRGAKHFDFATGQFTDSTGSTASSPGFSSLFHDLLAHWCAWDYCKLYNPPLASALFATIGLLESTLQDDFGNRNRDKRSGITASRDSNK